MNIRLLLICHVYILVFTLLIWLAVSDSILNLVNPENHDISGKLCWSSGKSSSVTPNWIDIIKFKPWLISLLVSKTKDILSLAIYKEILEANHT